MYLPLLFLGRLKLQTNKQKNVKKKSCVGPDHSTCETRGKAITESKWKLKSHCINPPETIPVV